MSTTSGGHRVLLAGRSRHADIQLEDPSVSRLHLEVVLGSGGEIQVADRSSRFGTFLRVDDGWREITASMVSRADRLRIGDLEIGVAELLRRIPNRRAARKRDRTPPGDLPAGGVRRHPETGELIPV